ncbi:MAG: hypothetical protein AAF458_06455 [Pseudomonadota bacterium]
MNLLVVGSGREPVAVASQFEQAGAHVELVTCSGHAVETLLRRENTFDMLLMDSDLDPADTAQLMAAAVRRRLLAVQIQAVAAPQDPADWPDNDPSVQPVDGSEPLRTLEGHEVERWRNVLTFAKRSPDSYPALRDALGHRTNLFQFHAPVKRSA